MKPLTTLTLLGSLLILPIASGEPTTPPKEKSGLNKEGFTVSDELYEQDVVRTQRLTNCYKKLLNLTISLKPKVARTPYITCGEIKIATGCTKGTRIRYAIHVSPETVAHEVRHVWQTVTGNRTSTLGPYLYQLRETDARYWAKRNRGQCK